MIAGIFIAAFGALAATVAVWLAKVLVGSAPPRASRAVQAATVEEVTALREQIAELRRASTDGAEEVERLRIMILRLRAELNEAQRETVKRELEVVRELGSARRVDVADDRSALVARAITAA